MGHWIMLALTSLLIGASSCTMDGTPLEAVDLDAMSFHVCGPNMGVHPDVSVLLDADNPFAAIAISDQDKWELQSAGSTVAAFYSWATLAARQPGGESQYYAAQNLKTIYQRQLASPELLPMARELSIRGFQALLEHFPQSVTYDATGTIAYDLATWAYKGIIELEGTVEGWILVDTSDGGQRAIRI